MTNKAINLPFDNCIYIQHVINKSTSHCFNCHKKQHPNRKGQGFELTLYHYAMDFPGIFPPVVLPGKFCCLECCLTYHAETLNGLAKRLSAIARCARQTKDKFTWKISATKNSIFLSTRKD